MKVVNFKKSYVKSGQKVANETVPQLTLTSTYNSFKLNDKACALLGVEQGDNVIMFDAFDANDPCSQEERFYICAADGWLTGAKNKRGEDIVHGAVLGETKGFNYSHIYGAMLNNDAEVEVAGYDYLESKGLVGKTPSGSKVSSKIITAELVPYQEEPVEIGEGEERILYKLVNFNIKDHAIPVEEEVTEEAVSDIEE